MIHGQEQGRTSFFEGNFVCTTLGFAKFSYVTLDFTSFPYATPDFDISFLSFLVFDNYHNCHSRGKSKMLRVAIVIIVKS